MLNLGCALVFAGAAQPGHGILLLAEEGRLGGAEHGAAGEDLDQRDVSRQLE